ncbi:hypothetical protein H0H87_007431 [Tephrocybe sp. NHM501043]|nr:hypothetical protein H0H87_007431 [Tephrocybe sp. NHM501043]
MAPIFSQAVKKTPSRSGISHSSAPTNKRASGEDTTTRPPQKRSRLAHLEAAAPLAEKLRPNALSDFVGQRHLTGHDSLLMKTLDAGSIIFWGPPGCGKTTLARLIAKEADCVFKELSATIVGINDVRATFEEAKNALALTGRKTVLFLDEIHRFNKSQQDIFLPYVEQGYIQLIGATTENPSFKLTGALLSRCRVFVLEKLADDEIMTVLTNAVERLGDSYASTDSEPSSLEPPQSSPDATGIPNVSFPQLTPKILSSITSLATGDARTALSLLELTIKSAKDTPEGTLLAALKRSVSASYDRTGESHYDMISALHKSVRGSQGSAAMYWLARMLTAGEDPMYIARRMVVCASEDIGLADKHALPLAMAALQACQTIGMPECRINLAHIVAYLSEAPKSTRAYEAYNRAEAAAKLDLTIPVPMSMRNAPTGLMKDLGYGKSYMYNPSYACVQFVTPKAWQLITNEFARHPVHNTYLPIQFQGEVFLRKEGDIADKIWDDAALSLWEHEANGDKDWDGRPGALARACEDQAMPIVPRDSPKDATFCVLVTGFGPFHHYEVNPSWLAVKPLHDTIITPTHQRPIHISALEIPVSYDAVLAVVPGLHARPPVLPPNAKPSFPPPPATGYDFIFHIGVAGRGPLRMERQGHKLGYHMKDADGKLASLARSSPKDFSRRPDDHLAAENLERERLGMEMVEHIGSDNSARPTRGFGVQYEAFPDELPTEIDVTRLVQELKQSGIEVGPYHRSPFSAPALTTFAKQIYTSMDAGHYLNDYIYYCSLAEAKRTANPYERRRNSQVLFLHCPPVNQPLSTEEVTEAIQQIICWVCKEMQIQDEENENADRLEGK